jgi:hypothetical protein
MRVGNTVVINRKCVCINLDLSGSVSRLNNRKQFSYACVLPDTSYLAREAKIFWKYICT